MDDLVLVSNGRRLSGWTEVSVSRGIERIPSGFTLSMTERYPGESGNLVLKTGDPVQVYLGSDLVVTGYVGKFIPQIRAGQHVVAVMGRGKCQDLIDCSHAWPTGQMANVTIEQIARNLCTPYGVSVTALADAGAIIPFVNLPWGDTPYSIIEQHARYRQLLVYEDAAGNLVLNQANPGKKATRGSLVQEGLNLEEGSMLFGMDQRFSEYVVRMLSLDNMSDVGTGGDVIVTVKDPGVPRFRRRSIIAETGDGQGYPVSQARAHWEAARRAGREMACQVTVDSWRNGDAVLWEPNQLVTVMSPSLRLPRVTWLIADVTYRRDATGTHADLVIMPAAAMQPQPINLFPSMSDVVGASK
jgi:prophage tail gpP-like protein